MMEVGVGTIKRVDFYDSFDSETPWARFPFRQGFAKGGSYIVFLVVRFVEIA
jgi:hypothetical protein